MEEIIWNFTSPTNLWVKLVETGREINVRGSNSSDNSTFWASSSALDGYNNLSRNEKRILKETLSYRTRNDQLHIVFD